MVFVGGDTGLTNRINNFGFDDRKSGHVYKTHDSVDRIVFSTGRRVIDLLAAGKWFIQTVGDRRSLDFGDRSGVAFS